MRTRLGKSKLAAVAVMLTLALQGCATILPGNDPLVVEAERFRKVQFQVVDTFLLIERRQEAEIRKQLGPSIHEVAERIRRDFPPAFRAFRDSLGVYKKTKSPGAKTDLLAALGAVQSFLGEVQPLLAKWGKAQEEKKP